MESLRLALTQERGQRRAALERQTVISEILRVINSSPSDPQPVFEAMARSGSKWFADARGVSSINVVLRKGDRLEIVAMSQTDPRREAASKKALEAAGGKLLGFYGCSVRSTTSW